MKETRASSSCAPSAPSARGRRPHHLEVILPNALPPLVVSATLGVGAAILFEAGLSFLGLGDPTR